MQVVAPGDDGGGYGYGEVILGLDGGTTSTVCVCMPLHPSPTTVSGVDCSLPDPPPILSRAVAGCSNHNSVGGTSPFSMTVCVNAVQKKA